MKAQIHSCHLACRMWRSHTQRTKKLTFIVKEAALSKHTRICLQTGIKTQKTHENEHQRKIEQPKPTHTATQSPDNHHLNQQTKGSVMRKPHCPQYQQHVAIEQSKITSAAPQTPQKRRKNANKAYQTPHKASHEPTFLSRQLAPTV